MFPEGLAFELSDSHLAVCVSSLQDVKLFNSNLLVVDEAFEYLVNKSAKGEKGQYFTPRHVIDMCVQMLNPKRGEYMIDTASGSCGFPVHTIFKLTGHLIVDHDLHNHAGKLPDGIAEAFIGWAKAEKLSFWKNGEDGSEAERRKAWQRFVANNRRREIQVDSDLDISDLCDEINDLESD